MHNLKVPASTKGAMPSDGFSEGLNPSPEFIAKWDQTRDNRELAAVLVEMRENAGLSQKELAMLMGKDQAFVSRMESATQRPKGDNIALYAKYCGLRTAYAFFNAEDKNKDGLCNAIKLHRMTEINQTGGTQNVATHVVDISIPCK